jgi:hypothetical protein
MPPHGLTPDPNELAFLRREVARLEALARRRGRALGAAGGAMLALGMAIVFGAVDVRHRLLSCRAKLVESRQGLSALARADRDATGAPATAAHPVREAGSPRSTIAM